MAKGSKANAKTIGMPAIRVDAVDEIPATIGHKWSTNNEDDMATIAAFLRFMGQEKMAKETATNAKVKYATELAVWAISHGIISVAEIPEGTEIPTAKAIAEMQKSGAWAHICANI